MESNDLSVDRIIEDSELSDVQVNKRSKADIPRITNFNQTMVCQFPNNNNYF